MSEQRRLSPLQPPISDSSRMMAQVQAHPNLPVSNFLARPDPRPAMPFQAQPLPSIRSLLNRPDGLPPLPPLEPQPQPTQTKLPIQDLLSQGSPPARAPPIGYNQPPTQRSPPDLYRVSGGGPRPEQAYGHPATSHHQHTLGGSSSGYPPSNAYSVPPPRLYMPARPSPVSSAQDSPRYSPRSTSQSMSPSSYSQTTQPRLPRSQVSQPPPFGYTLSIRQQPIAARACGFGERDRRVIDPPPILELKITDRETGRPEQDHNGLLALHCTLMTPDGKQDDTEVQNPESNQPAMRRLMGTLVASPYQAKDEHGVAGTFFVFPDLSCRSPGKYRLRFKLLRIDPMAMVPGMTSPCVSTMMTDVFHVYTAKDFPGMRASSSLLVALRRQGLNVGVKKGSEARKGKGKTKKESGSSGEDDDSSEDSDDGRRGSGGTTISGSTAGGVSPKTKTSSSKKKQQKRKRRES